MPYYRIVIWTSQRREPFTGIRQIENYNIDAVHHIIMVKAEETYRRDLIDVEVQMISKVSTAVKNHLKKIQRKREDRKWPAPTPNTPTPKRRDYYRAKQEILPIGQQAPWVNKKPS